MKLLLLMMAAVLLPAAAEARTTREMVELKAGEPVVIRPDRAYLLLRTFRPEGVPSIEPVLMRVPTAEELQRFEAAKRDAFAKAEPKLVEAREAQLRRKAEGEAAGRPFKGEVPPPPSIDTFNFDYRDAANVQSIDDSRALIKGRPESTYLVEVIPGEFVFYGASFAGGAPGLHICMCLGTIGFSAKAGVVTDLGTFLADSARGTSKIPELKPESGLGPSSDSLIVLLVTGLRPPTPGASVPEVVRGATIRPVDYHAVGKYVDQRALGINRLVPIPGVLAYDDGRVIDVKTGKAVEDRF